LIVEVLPEHLRTVVELMHQLKKALLGVTCLQQLPHLLSLWLRQTIVQDIPSYQNDLLLEKKLGEKGEYRVRGGVGSLALEILQKGAQLRVDRGTKQFFCHWVRSLKCPPFL
jgi:hypothetical protein